jgi:UDPglucose 6-dehydrogenase
MGLDHRIGPKFLHAGAGFGGSCFPKDAQALVRFAAEKGERLRIAEAALDVNHAQRERMVRKTEQALGGLWGRRIALLGLPFKPNTDDIRESPALELAERYHGVRRHGGGARSRGHAQRSRDAGRAAAQLRHRSLTRRPRARTRSWSQPNGRPYRELDLKRIAWLLQRPVLLDLRGIFSPQDAVNAGLDYPLRGEALAARRRLRPVAAVEPVLEQAEEERRDRRRPRPGDGGR